VEETKFNTTLEVESGIRSGGKRLEEKYNSRDGAGKGKKCRGDENWLQELTSPEQE